MSTPLAAWFDQTLLIRVQDANLARWPGGDWVGNQKAFNDADHGGSLGAAYAAWRWARGIA